MPTLDKKGNLRSYDGDPAVERELAQWVPIEYIIEWFRRRQNKTGITNRVLVLKGETASGKSTYLLQKMYEALILPVRGPTPGIVCTQPRRITAISNVKEILKYATFLKLGENIGWSTGYDKFRPRGFGLLSCTIGTLKQQLRVMTDDEIMNTYRYILIDETHERDLNIDITIYMLKNFLLRCGDNPKCPFVVLMSATFEPDKFVRYFGGTMRDNFVWCTGAAKFIDERWDWNQGRSVNDYTRTAAALAGKIAREAQGDDPTLADILIFMPGKAEITETANYLTPINAELVRDGLRPFIVLGIDSEAQQQKTDEFQMTFRPLHLLTVHIGGKTYKPMRRIVISTNMAETGLTLENLKYVIDSGYNRENEFNPNYGVQVLVTRPAPISRIRQRRGRVGRNFDGVFYPLYPQYLYEQYIPKQQLPQILTTDVSPIMIDIIIEQLRYKLYRGERDPVFMVQDIDMLDNPAMDSIQYSIEQLYTLGFISPVSVPYKAEMGDVGDTSWQYRFGYGLTKLGYVISQISAKIPLESLRMIIGGYFWDCCPLDLATIAAYLQVKSDSFPLAALKTNEKASVDWAAIYHAGVPPRILSGDYKKVRELIGDDFIEAIIVFQAITMNFSEVDPAQAIAQIDIWCKQVNMKLSTAMNFIRTRDEIINSFLENRIDIFHNSDKLLLRADADQFVDIVTRIKRCIYDGYRGNLLELHGEKYLMATGAPVKVPSIATLERRPARPIAVVAPTTTIASAANTPAAVAPTATTTAVAVTAEDAGGIRPTPASEANVPGMPQFLLYDSVMPRYNRNTGMYVFKCDRVCVLDGYVKVDRLFI